MIEVVFMIEDLREVRERERVSGEDCVYVYVCVVCVCEREKYFTLEGFNHFWSTEKSVKTL